MRIEAVGTRCPVLADVTVGVQHRSDVIDEHPADGSDNRWALDVDVTDNDDFRGPFVHGRPGAQCIYLSWQHVDTGMFRRAKLMLDAVPVDVLRAARGATLIAEVALSMPNGAPLCAAVRPPQITWAAEVPGATAGSCSTRSASRCQPRSGGPGAFGSEVGDGSYA